MCGVCCLGVEEKGHGYKYEYTTYWRAKPAQPCQLANHVHVEPTVPSHLQAHPIPPPQGPASKAASLIATLLPDNAPDTLLSPVLWDQSQVEELLRGSPVVEEAAQRRAAIDDEWGVLEEQAPGLLPPGVGGKGGGGERVLVLICWMLHMLYMMHVC